MHAWNWSGWSESGDWRDSVADADEPLDEPLAGFEDVIADLADMAGVVIECTVAPVMAFAEGAARADFGWRWGRFTAEDAKRAEEEEWRGRHRGRAWRHRGGWHRGFGAKETPR